MRTLTATLTAAARSASSSPYVRVRAIRKIGAVGRLDWERLYTGGEADKPAGIAQAADGSIVRIRVSPTDKVQIQRTASPTAASDWGSWPAGAGTNVVTVAICPPAAGSAMVAFYATFGVGDIYWSYSADNGANWTAWAQIDPGGAGPIQMAASYNTAGSEILLAYDRGGTVYTKKYSGGAWGAATVWTNTAGSITGLALEHLGDWNLIITGTEAVTLNPKVWTCIYGDGYSYGAGTWGPLTELTGASAGSGVDFWYPALAMADVYRCLFQEVYAGTTAYHRPHHTHSLPSASFVDSLWREPVPFNLEPSYYGIALAYTTGAYVYASTNAGVWRAPLVTGTGLDITADVTALVATASLSSQSLPQRTGERAGVRSATIALDNSSGKYATLGAGALLELQRGSMLTIDPGYRTTAGAEVSSGGPTYWIESIAYSRRSLSSQERAGVRSSSMAELVIEAIDAWGLLARWHARKQHAWPAGEKNIYQLVAWILARVGLETTSTGQNSAQLSSLAPAFTIHPGESGATALTKALARVPDRIIWKGTTGYLHRPLASDASQYSYGTTHAIYEGQYKTESQRANQAQVLGLSHFSEDFNWTEIGLVYNRTAQVHDISLSDAAGCLARAQAELRDQAIASRADTVTVPAHPGQELLDVVAITDATAGLAAAKRRVVAMRLEHAPTKPAYTLALTLGDV